MLNALRSIVEGMGRERIDYINLDAATLEKLRAEVAEASNEHISELTEFLGIPIGVVYRSTTVMYLEIGSRS